MKKNYLYIAIAIIVMTTPISQTVFSQKVIDKALYRCQYKTTTLKDTLDMSYLSTDVMNLDIGENSVVFYSSRKDEKDAYTRKMTESGSFDMNTIKESPKGVNNYKVYTNYPNGKITYQDELVGRRNNYYYEEDLLPIQWTITSEKKLILKYNCQKATCSYMGRNYEAWFTTEIPIKYGPYKFSGLPGLILKLHDTKNHYVFEATGFEQLLTPENIIYDVKGFQKISKNDFLKIQYSFITDPLNFIAQSLGVKIEGISTPGERSKEGIRSDAYLPIELSK